METTHRFTVSAARVRTILANERTLLAYIRTAIMLGFSGITAIKLFPRDRLLFTLGLVLIPLAVGVALFGYVRFQRVRDRVSD
jgi:putative membrane protein